MGSENSYILAIDQGTTGTTALIFDRELRIHGKVNHEFPQHFPKPGWVEHDLDEIWKSVLDSVNQVFEKGSIRPDQIAAIGVTNQRETTCLWNRNEEATAVAKAIVWQDRRTAAHCARLKKSGAEKTVKKRTGLLLDPYFSGTKIAWLLKENSEAKAAAKSGRLAFGTIDSFLLYRMTGEHKTDPSNASRTLLMNLKSCDWDREMMKLLKVPESILPEICDSGVEYGRTKSFACLPDGIPVTGMAGDQQAALFGQAGFKPGNAKSTYGTGAFVLANTGTKPVMSKNRLLTSVAWRIKGKTTYCLEGSAFIAGAAVQWLRDQLQIVDSAPEIEKLALSVDDNGGVFFVPALSGMGAPHWLPHATGMLTGLTRGSSRGHIARATLEGIAFQIAELLGAMTKDMGKKISPLKVDGGASNNELLMQFQSDVLGVPVVRSAIVETTALGAGLQAGLGVGLWSDLKEIEGQWKASGEFRPKMKATERRKRLDRWMKTVKAVQSLAV